MVRVSHAIAEIANIAPDTHQAYVGAAAFAHKAGLHASAIKVDPVLYNHIDPAVVGNDMRILVTEMAGRASVELKSRELGLDLAGHPDAVSARRRPGQGAGGAAAGRSRRPTPRSSCWCARRWRHDAPCSPFALESYRVLVEHREDGEVVSEATVKVGVDGERVIATAEGNGPVNALDEALRAALAPGTTRSSRDVELADYKVRILARGRETRGTGRGHPGAGGDDRRRRAGGRRSACTTTSSRPPGTRWSTRWPTRGCDRARRTGRCPARRPAEPALARR